MEKETRAKFNRAFDAVIEQWEKYGTGGPRRVAKNAKKGDGKRNPELRKTQPEAEPGVKRIAATPDVVQ